MRHHAVTALLVAHERLAEMNLVKLGHQHLPQRDAADRAVPRDRTVVLHHRGVDRQQRLHVLGDKVDRAPGLAASAIERIEQVRRQALVQRKAAARTDVDAIALQAARERLVALIDRGADSLAPEALREREPADAATDDDDVQRPRRRVERLHPIRRVHRRIPAAWISSRNVPIATRNTLMPTGEPQPYQLIAFSEYFQASASVCGWMSDEMDMSKLHDWRSRRTRRCCSGRASTDILEDCGPEASSAPRSCLWFEAPAMFQHRRGRLALAPHSLHGTLPALVLLWFMLFGGGRLNFAPQIDRAPFLLDDPPDELGDERVLGAKHGEPVFGLDGEQRRKSCLPRERRRQFGAGRHGRQRLLCQRGKLRLELRNLAGEMRG